MTGYPGVKVRVAGVALDTCNIGMPLQVTHGRASVTTQPDPPTLELAWMAATPPATVGDPINVTDAVGYDPATWGDPVTVWADAGALWGGGDTLESIRFAGVVDQLVTAEAGGVVVSWQVSAVGGQASLGYRPVNLPTRPVETDVARVQAIANAAGVAVTILGTAGVRLAAGDVKGDALDLLHAVCESTGGLLWQDRSGRLTYGTANHRANLGGPQLPCEVIEDGLEWAEATDTIVNEVTLSWGPADTQQQVTHRDSESIARPWGVRHTDVTTIVATEADADELGQLILARRSFPYWGTPAVVVAADALTDADARAVSQLDVSTGVLLPLPLTQPGPVPTDPALGVLEGWVETWDESGHTLQLAVGDKARWTLTRLRTWNEADSVPWSYWRPVSWSDALIKEPEDPV